MNKLMKLKVFNIYLQNYRHGPNQSRHLSVAADLILLAWLIGVLVGYLYQFRDLIDPILMLFGI